jgi:hypothetical protein
VQAYEPYYGPQADPLKVGPLPYPMPCFLWYAPFSHLTPPVGFLLWAAANLLLAAHVARGLAARLGDPSWSMTVALLTFFPLAYGLFVGQPVVALLFAFDNAYSDLERGRDFRAGLWAGILLFKVQYPLLLAIVFLMKRRWRALAGLATTATLIVVSSLVALGPSGTMGYLVTLRSMSGFREVHPIIYPHQMINWRGLLVNVLPASATEAQGRALTLALSALTMSTLPFIWRGPWESSNVRFPAQILATMLITMLCCFHNHLHGATLLLVPAVALLGHGGASPSLRLLLGLGFFAPTALFAMTRDPHRVAGLGLALIVLILGRQLGLLSGAKNLPTIRPRVRELQTITLQDS